MWSKSEAIHTHEVAGHQAKASAGVSDKHETGANARKIWNASPEQLAAWWKSAMIQRNRGKLRST